MKREETLEAIGPVRQNPAAPGLLVVGFRAWSAAWPETASADPLREELEVGTTRAVHDVEGGRLALTAREHDSLEDALEGLADTLEANQLAELPRGPDGLGEAAFVHPPQAPPAAFFVRGNLVLSVTSFGAGPVDALPYARRIDAELAERPAEVREDGIEVVEEGKTLRVEARWAGPDAYLKYMAPGGRLRKAEDGVVVEGEPEAVEVFVVERGRPTRGRRIRG